MTLRVLKDNFFLIYSFSIPVLFLPQYYENRGVKTIFTLITYIKKTKTHSIAYLKIQ